jgi:hypothetical protein
MRSLHEKAISHQVTQLFSTGHSTQKADALTIYILRCR